MLRASEVVCSPVLMAVSVLPLLPLLHGLWVGRVGGSAAIGGGICIVTLVNCGRSRCARRSLRRTIGKYTTYTTYMTYTYIQESDLGKSLCSHGWFDSA